MAMTSDLPESLRAFPKALLKSQIVDGTPLNKILLEIVIYPLQITVDHFDWLLDLYGTLCPADRINFFKITEFPFWSDVSDPVLTQSARASQRKEYRFFEAARKRIREGRGFEAQLWDGCEITDRDGTYNLNIQALKSRALGLSYYVRFLFPLDFPNGQLVSILCTLAERLDLYSGHGGPVFAFVKDKKYEAFTEIYAKARRFWGVDIDMLDLIPHRMRTELKSPCWLNVLGSPFRDDPDLLTRIRALRAESDISVHDQAFGTVFVLGKQPSSLDRNRLAKDVHLYQAMAKVMDGYILDGVGPLAGDGFLANADATNEWLHRFSPGSDWPVLRNVQ
jgi:hypothetical protein